MFNNFGVFQGATTTSVGLGVLAMIEAPISATKPQPNEAGRIENLTEVRLGSVSATSPYNHIQANSVIVAVALCPSLYSDRVFLVHSFIPSSPTLRKKPEENAGPR